MFAAFALVFGLSACDGGIAGDSAGDPSASELGQCPDHDGCADLCRSIEDDLTYIAQEGGGDWTADDAADLDELCTVAEGATDCEECAGVLGPEILNRWSVCFMGGMGFESEEIRMCEQEDEDDWSTADFTHFRDSYFATCELYDLQHEGETVSAWMRYPECEDSPFTCQNLCVAQGESAGYSHESALAACAAEPRTQRNVECDECYEAILDALGLPGNLTPEECAFDFSAEATEPECYSVCEDYDVWY